MNAFALKRPKARFSNGLAVWKAGQALTQNARYFFRKGKQIERLCQNPNRAPSCQLPCSAAWARGSSE